MAMIIREYIDGNFYHEITESTESSDITENIDDEISDGIDMTEADSQHNIDPDSIMVDIEGIHGAPFVTRNFTRYMPKCLKKSVPSWTKPYRKPLIKHHNDENGEIIGRICDARYKESGTLSGTPAIEFTVNVPGKAKEDVKNGLLETTSIGAIAHDVRCSICGQQLAGGEECSHERGVKYGSEVCTWDIYSMEAKELSYVIVPSDIFSKNINVYPATKSKSSSKLTENLDKNINAKGEYEESMADNKNTDAEKIASLEKDIKDLKQAKETAESSIADLTNAKTDLEAKVAALEGEKTQLETQCRESEELKTALETELADAKAEIRENLMQMVQFMRKVGGKTELSKETLESRSTESLKDSIVDMKEDFLVSAKNGIDTKESVDTTEQNHDNTPKPNSVNDPTINNDGKDTKESADNKKTLNLKDELFSAIYGISNLHSC